MGLVTGLAAAATVGGALLSSSSSNRASRRAAETSENNNAQNNALAREIYGNNQQVLSPFVNRGNAAGDQLNALLGLGGQPANQAVQPNASTQFTGGQPAGFGYGLGDGFIGPGSFGNYGGRGFNPASYGDAGLQPSETYGVPLNSQGGAAVGGGQPMGQTSQEAAESAFDTFRNSTGYQFRRGEGLDAVTSAYAGIGGLQSGAAMRGINDYATGMADSTFGQYAGLLSGQQAVGAGAASSLAGVGQNFAGTVINSNNQNAYNQMNAQLGQQNGFANALGAVGGGLFQYGLGG